jgi:hypothetical protein
MMHTNSRVKLREKGTALKVEKKVEISEPVRHHFEKLNDESIDCKTGWTVSSV